jgi:hypothetical protein
MKTTIEKSLENAIRSNDCITIKQLLDAGVQPDMRVNTRGYGSQPLLFIAIEKSYIEIIRILLEYGANPNTLHPTIWIRRNAIHLLGKVVMPGLPSVAERIEILKLLIEHGGDINSKDQDGLTLLHNLVFNNKCNMDELIYEAIRLGADVNAKDKEGNTPLYYACVDMNNFYLIPTLVRAGADINTINNKRETIIVSLLKRLRTLEAYFIRHVVSDDDYGSDYSWDVYWKDDYFLGTRVRRSHKKDVEILIKMLAEHGARVSRFAVAEYLDPLKEIPDDVLNYIERYIEEDPIDVAMEYKHIDAAKLMAGMRGIVLR